MGAAASKNKSSVDVFNESISENLNQMFTSIAQQSISSVSPTQSISIRVKTAGTLRISGLTQKIVANIDVQKFIKNVSESQLQGMLRSSVETVAKDNQAIEHALVIGGSVTSNESTANVRARNVNRIVNSYSYNQFVSDANSILPAQTVVIEGEAGKDIEIEDVNQYVKADIISKNISDTLTKTFAELQTESETSTTKETTQTSTSGISAFAIFGIVLVFIIIVAIAAAVWYFKMGGREQVATWTSQASAASMM